MPEVLAPVTGAREDFHSMATITKLRPKTHEHVAEQLKLVLEMPLGLKPETRQDLSEALSCYAPELMGARITGELSLGIALGILQLVVTFAAVFSYERSAQRSVDPLARVVRERAADRSAGVAR